MMDVLFIHCLDCVAQGKKDNLTVLVIDGEQLHVACNNHDEPKHIWSMTIPVEERGHFQACDACKSDRGAEHIENIEALESGRWLKDIDR